MRHAPASNQRHVELPNFLKMCPILAERGLLPVSSCERQGRKPPPTGARKQAILVEFAVPIDVDIALVVAAEVDGRLQAGVDARLQLHVEGGVDAPDRNGVLDDSPRLGAFRGARRAQDRHHRRATRLIGPNGRRRGEGLKQPNSSNGKLVLVLLMFAPVGQPRH
jgi:hypothetical protein